MAGDIAPRLRYLDINDDGLFPLADDLSAILNRFNRPFRGDGNDHTIPPKPGDLDRVYKSRDTFGLVITLKAHYSPVIGKEIEEELSELRTIFGKITQRAREILNSETGEVIWQHPIEHLRNHVVFESRLNAEVLRKDPSDDTIPENLRNVEAEVDGPLLDLQDKFRQLIRKLRYIGNDIQRRKKTQTPNEQLARGIVPSYPCGIALDAIMLGPLPTSGNEFTIYDTDVFIVNGDTPTVCPKTDRPIGAEWLPDILKVFQRLNRVKAGQTIHWVGTQSKLEHVCTCFRNGAKPDASNGKTLRGKRGRKGADAETRRREAEIVERWKQAGSAGVYKVDFARDENMTLDEFKHLQDRVRGRDRPKSNSDK